jgi:hypothetical protein
MKQRHWLPFWKSHQTALIRGKVNKELTACYQIRTTLKGLLSFPIGSLFFISKDARNESYVRDPGLFDDHDTSPSDCQASEHRCTYFIE